MNKYTERILITGVSGFIGKALCIEFSEKYNLYGIDTNVISEIHAVENLIIEHSDITDYGTIAEFINIHKPDIVIHCAGIAHQKLGRVSTEDYFNINSHATENLAKTAVKANPDVYFIFLSSISVYGEENVRGCIAEDYKCRPSSDYASSKLDAEKRLIKLYKSSFLKRLDILRLAPVYDSEWSLNLDKRVFAPKKLVYLKFGSGEQTMSAVSRQNLVDFIKHRINQEKGNSSESIFCNIVNVCDKKPYKFKEIITVFKESDYQPGGFVLTVPLIFVWIATRIAGLVFRRKQQWLHSCHDKLKLSLVFDNSKMLNTGFKHKNSLKSVFLKSDYKAS